MTLTKAIHDFLSHCRFEKHLSPKTIKAYQIDLTQLRTFLEKHSGPMEASAVSKYELKDYVASIASLKPKSIKRKIASAKAFFNYLEFEDNIVVNPFRKMRLKIREPHRLPSVLDMKEIVSLFKVGYKYKSQAMNEHSYTYLESVRNIVVLELLFSTGARVSEIANLKVESVNLHTGVITIRGKGNKERIIQICNKETILILKDYYRLFESKISLSSGWFFVNRLNGRLSEQSIRNMVKRIAYESGISKRVTPHIFRHSFATLLLERDVDIKYIQAMLGHSSIMTTQIYTHVNRVKQKQILRSKHPRKDFTMGEG